MILKGLNSLLRVTSVILVATLTYACDKPKELDRAEEKPLVGTKLYTASSLMETYRFEDEIMSSELGNDESLRAILSSAGYQKPSLNLSTEEFKEHNIKGHFSVVGGSVSEQNSTTELLEAEPTTKLDKNALFIREANGANAKAQIDMYCQLPNNLQTTDTYVCLALGGKLDGSKLDYMSEKGTSPNKLIKGIKAGEEETGRELPLMTNFAPFNKVFSQNEKTEQIYKPRGALIGFCFVNKLGESVTLTKFSFPESNALFFEGSFDLGKTEANALPQEADTKARFIGVDRAFTFDIASENATLEPVVEEVSTAKTKLPLFYVWGFAHQGQAKLKMKLHYTKGSEEKVSKLIELDVPEGGFKDGSAYRIPLVLGKKSSQNKPQAESEETITTLKPYQALPNRKDYNVRALVNTNKKYHYRLLLAVNKPIFEKEFHSSKNEVYDYWREAEAFLNEAYNRDLGIYFTILKEDRFILTDKDVITPLNAYNIGYPSVTSKMDDLFGADNYDVGGWLSRTGGASKGYAIVGGAYRKSKRASLVVAVKELNVLGHELGHLFGANHIHTDDAKTSLKIEKGLGQSFMGGAGDADFFNPASIAEIFSYLNHYPYAKDTAKKQIIDPYSLSQHNNITSVEELKKRYNIVYAEEVSTTAPQIDRAKLKQTYRVPTGSFFSLKIPVKNANNNMLYTAVPIQKDDGNFYIHRAGKTGCINMQKVYSRAGGLEFASEPVKVAGKHKLRLSVSTFNKGTNPVPQYDYEDVELEIVNAQPFVIKTNLGQGQVSAGRKVKLKWAVDQSFFKNDSKVRISMSDDYGQTYKYILAEETENDGECEIVLPYIETNKLTGIYNEAIYPCIIKVEELGGIVYALTEYNPRNKWGKFAGGFTLSQNYPTNGTIVFENCPVSVLELNSEADLPAVSTYEIVAKYKFNNRYTTKSHTYSQSETRTLSDGRKYVIREWTTPDPSFSRRFYAFRQYIYIKK